LASLFHHEPLLCHQSIDTTTAADDDLFNAPTAEDWKQLLLQQEVSDVRSSDVLHVNLPAHPCSQPVADELAVTHSRFTAYTILHGLLVTVCNKQQRGRLLLRSTEFNKHFDALICWHNTFLGMASGSNQSGLLGEDALCLTTLWHSAFMNLLVDFNILEQTVGRIVLQAPRSNLTLRM